MSAPIARPPDHQRHIARYARRLLNGRSHELARLARADIDTAWRLAWERARGEIEERNTMTAN